MGIGVYKNVSQKDIEEKRYTSEGKTYDLNHNADLVVDMKFKGQENAKNNSEINSQGWERDQKYYFNELSTRHPEYFSEKNKKNIENGKAPIVDGRFIKHFPEYKSFKGETLVHHHIGGDGQAVAIPKSMHKGFGEIHNEEKKLGITKNGQDFSRDCEKYCTQNPSAYGKTSGQLKNEMEKERSSEFNVPLRNGNSKNKNCEQESEKKEYNQDMNRSR